MNTKTANPVDTTVGKRIKQARETLDMSQTDLGNAIGVTFQQVQKYESAANRVSASRLVMIADAMGVTPAYFLKGLGKYE